MKKYQVQIAIDAVQDIKNIHSYITFVLKNPIDAVKKVAKLRERMGSWSFSLLVMSELDGNRGYPKGFAECPSTDLLSFICRRGKKEK